MQTKHLASAARRSAKPGDIITFGMYPQAAEGTERTPITWRVLDRSDGELFIVSEYILDCKRYHAELADITWRDCNLREWLNDEFYNAAFSAAEKRLVKTTHCADNGEGSPDTDDRVFLLSVKEIQVFTDPGDGNDTSIRRRTVGTEFARAKKPDGCWLYVYDKGIEKDYVIENGDKRGCSWWWTRSQVQAEHRSRATFIGARSNIKTYGQVNLRYYGVRPALRLKA